MKGHIVAQKFTNSIFYIMTPGIRKRQRIYKITKFISLNTDDCITIIMYRKRQKLCERKVSRFNGICDNVGKTFAIFLL